jgi:hypothetical protein
MKPLLKAFLLGLLFLCLAGMGTPASAALHVPMVPAASPTHPAGYAEMGLGVCLSAYRHRPVSDPTLRKVCQVRYPYWRW